MRTTTLTALLVVGCVACPVWAGEETSWSGESGAPAPLSGRHVMTVKSQEVQITLVRPGPRGFPEAVVRVEYVLTAEPSEEGPVEVGFPVCYEGVPTGDGERFPPAPPRAYVKLDGRAVDVRFVAFEELARPRVQERQEEIETLLDRVPGLAAEASRIREEGKQQGEGWLQAEGVRELGAWLQEKVAREGLGGADATWVAGGILGVRPRSGWGRLDQAVQGALMWLDPERERVNVYEELAEEWGHERLLLDAATGQLVDSRSIAWEHLFGAFVFDIGVEGGGEHTLVVQHRQPLGFLDMGGTVGLRYVLTRARRWGGYFRPTIEVRVPAEWGPVALRPPAMESAREGGMQVYRVRLKERPVEEVYVSAGGWGK